jgi:glycosyltransferase involved in cell wall biosynthesis
MRVKGLVSTIIPVYNRPTLLYEAVNSVLEQTYRPIEIIIVDDGSTDDTPQAAATVRSISPNEIKVLRVPNGGPGAAREVGRKRARGEFIQYLDSDDILLPEKFTQQIAGLHDDPDCGVSYGKTLYQELDSHPSYEPWKRTGERISKMFPSFLVSRWWGTSTPLYRRRLTDQAGAWLSLKNEEDWEYDCRIASLGVRLHYTDSFVSVQRSHGGNRLSEGGSNDPVKLADRAKAHEAILGHARDAGILLTSPEMQHFARELFLLSRQCGSSGLNDESKKLFQLSQEASSLGKRAGLDFHLYKLAARAIGWKAAGKIACHIDKIRQ